MPRLATYNSLENEMSHPQTAIVKVVDHLQDVGCLLLCILLVPCLIQELGDANFAVVKKLLDGELPGNLLFVEIEDRCCFTAFLVLFNLLFTRNLIFEEGGGLADEGTLGGGGFCCADHTVNRLFCVCLLLRPQVFFLF